MLQRLVFFMLAALLLSISSCDTKPSACFRTDIDEDSIHVNQLVTFTSACSSNASDYFWEFYDNDDSVEFTPSVKKIFRDTGNVKVYLLITNGRKESSTVRSIHINP